MTLRKRIVPKQKKNQIPTFLESDVDLFLSFMGLKLFAVTFTAENRKEKTKKIVETKKIYCGTQNSKLIFLFVNLFTQ
jgi:hypothetical protein